MAEYKRISEQLELPLKLNNTKSLLQVGGNSGIIKETIKKPITLITDKAIDSVPLVEIHGLTETQNKMVQEYHRELLRYARNNNANKEVAFVLNAKLKNMGIFIGSDDVIDFGNRLQGANLIVLHNHPRNSSYSYADIMEFITNKNLKMLTIVKNNGNVEVLQKLLDYNHKELLTELRRLEKKYVMLGNDSEYTKAIKKFIEKYNNKGEFKWIIQGI